MQGLHRRILKSQRGVHGRFAHLNRKSRTRITSSFFASRIASSRTGVEVGKSELSTGFIPVQFRLFGVRLKILVIVLAGAID